MKNFGLKEKLHSFLEPFTILFSYLISIRILELISWFFKNVYWHALRRRFKHVGEGSSIEYPAVILGEQYISIGDNFLSFARLRMEAFDTHSGYSFSPEIIIGDNVSLNYDCHIGCINRIQIGNNVLIASRVYITDHFHGEITKESLNIPIQKRKLISKGPVLIEDNVWIGEGAVILPNITIGKNSIVGANAVVTRNVIPNTVVGGVPAKLIKVLK